MLSTLLPPRNFLRNPNRFFALYEAYKRPEHIAEKIGNREVVGYGFNGQECYVDRLDFPFPAIRFKEPTAEILGLRQKEKGDWRLLTMEEKKTLYRSSFCQTFAELKAPHYEWMSDFGYSLLLVSLGIWLYILMRWYVYEGWPIQFTKPYRRAQLRRMIDLQVDPITGMASKWDYEENKWKKGGWFLDTEEDNPFQGTDWCT